MMIPLKTSLVQLVSAAPTKIMTTLILYIARAMLVLYTTCKRFISSPNHNSLWILLNLVVIILFVLHRINSKHAIQAPLFSFPSLSQPLVSLASISLTQPLSSFRSISRPLVSLPSISLQTIFGAPSFRKRCAQPVDTVVASPPPPKPDDVVILDSVTYQGRNIYLGAEAPDEEENMSMEDAWNAILASGSAKPVKLKKSVKQDRIPERVVPKSKVKNSDNGRKKKEKQAEKMEERVEGWRRRDALVIAHDDLSRRAEAFIKKQHDYLKLQREESDRRRLLERMHISENAF